MDLREEEILPTGGGEIPPTYVPPKKPGFVKGILVGSLATIACVLVLAGIGGTLMVKVLGNGVMDATTKTKLAFLTDLTKENYYEDVDDAKLREGLYHGLISGLGDPYSEYYSKEEYEDFKMSTLGNYAGIGALLSQDKKTMVVTVTKVYDDSPAQKADIRAGDIIVSVDGYEAVKEKLDDFVQRIRGEENTTLEMVMMRDGEEQTKTVERAIVTIPSVYGEMLGDGIGLIEITDFSVNTENEFKETLQSLEKQGLKALVFDLRTNGGGLVSSVTDILDDILPEGTVVYTIDKKGEKTTYTSDNEHQIDCPMVVLTSGNTASAAEIFAGAIHDFNYGTLIGKKTYGKGVVQYTYPLPDGSAAKLTFATYYTPSGKCIHKKGIKPDIDIEYKYTGDPSAKDYDYSKDNQVQKAIEILKKEM